MALPAPLRRAEALAPRLASHSYEGREIPLTGELSCGRCLDREAAGLFCGLMSISATPMSMTTTGTAEAVALPRRHLVAIAILVCVPLPLFSVGAMVVPMPSFVERATATFMSFAAPVLDRGGPFIRERKVAVRSVEIVYTPRESRASLLVSEQSTRAVSVTSSRGVPARGGFDIPTTAAPAGGGSQVNPTAPDAGPADEPTDTGSPGSGGDPVPEDPPTGAGAPGDGRPAPVPTTEPPSATPPAPGGGTKGGSQTPPSGGGSQTPPSGGGTPPDGKGGGTPPDAGNDPPAAPGNGQGSPPEPPAGGGTPPGSGHGRP